MKDKLPPGTRSIARAVSLLTVLGTRKQIGWRLTDLAAQCALDDSTVHRIMTCLSMLRLVQQRKSDRRYIPGPMLFELALGFPAYSSLQSACHTTLIRVVKNTGWNAFLYLRSGEESVCLDRIGGPSSVLPLIDVGGRRPLAGSSMGIAMLLGMPVQERQAILIANRKRFKTATAHRKRGYDRMWKRSITAGIGLNLGDVLPSGGSIAVPIIDARKRPFAALGVSGPLEEFTRTRIDTVAAMLLNEARQLEIEQAELLRITN